MLQGLTEGYKGLQGVTGGYRRLQGIKEHKTGLQRVQGLEKVRRAVEGVTGGYNGLEVRGGYKRLKRMMTRGYKGLQRVTRG